MHGRVDADAGGSLHSRRPRCTGIPWGERWSPEVAVSAPPAPIRRLDVSNREPGRSEDSDPTAPPAGAGAVDRYRDQPVPQPTVPPQTPVVDVAREMAWPDRVFTALRPMRGWSRAELRIVQEARQELDFEPLLPDALPLPYRLTAARLVPYCRTLATFAFRAPRSREFQLTEQLAPISFEVQSRSSRLPSTRLRFDGGAFTVMHGAFNGTEPIDGLHWNERRRVIAWDRGGVICQLELQRGRSPSVWQGLKIAASLLPLSVLVEGQRGRGG